MELKIDKSAWVSVTLGEVAFEVSDRIDAPAESEYDRFVGLEHFVSGEVKIQEWESTRSLVSAAKAFRKGDVLFARRNAYLRRASMVDFDGCCSGDAYVLRENNEVIVPGLLPFIVNSNSLWDFANSNAAGTMSKRVKWKDLANYEFLLPPKDQQAEIAELLWAIDEREQALQVLDNVFFKLKSAHVKVAFNKSQGKRVKLRDISISRDNLRVPIKKSARVKGATPYYGASGVVDYVEGWTHDEPLVLISEDGENLSTRKKPIAMKTDGKVWINNHIHALSVSVNRYLLVESINSMGIEGYIDDGTRPKLTKASLESIPVALPVKEDWDYWEALFQQIDTAKGLIRRNDETGGLLMKSLLNQLFSDV